MSATPAPRRGELVTVALQGAYGKPRPALVVQADAFAALPSVTVLLLTSERREAPLLRIPVPAGPTTGLRLPSQIMVDKAQTLPRAKLGPSIGRIDAPTLERVSRALAAFLGLDR